MGDGDNIRASGTHTTHKVVLPFYVYAALAYLAGTVLLLCSTPAFSQHYFHPHTLAITHTIALGWGTMIILGASHQLVPVLVESGLYSIRLARFSFVSAATGIPLLVYGFYVFDLGMAIQVGAILVNLAVISFIVNLGMSIIRARQENVHAVFVFTAACWLLATTMAGLLLVYNFSYPIFSRDSLSYLSLHAHMGIVGWFLLMVLGVGSRLIPMFLISKYENPRLLWTIYALINSSLAGFAIVFLFLRAVNIYPVFIIMAGAALIIFGYYIVQSFRERIRRAVDNPVRLSILSVLMMLLPLLILLALIVSRRTDSGSYSLTLTYGFTIFFGWLTAIILGMTFKTLPFIVWNREFQGYSGNSPRPDPKDLFNASLVKWMMMAYLAGFVLFATGTGFELKALLQPGAALLLFSAFAYIVNVIKLVLYRRAKA